MAKSFAWSFSKLKNYETCPKRHFEIDLAKNYSDGGGEALTWGNAVHGALAQACMGTAELPADMKAAYQKWVDRVRAGPGDLYVEQKYAIDSSFNKTSWFGPLAWYRGIGDVVRIAGDVALVLDWKTGKVIDDSVQLGLMAQCIFSHYPEVLRVRAEYVWLKEDATTGENFSRESLKFLWTNVLPRVDKMKAAGEAQNYPPTPSFLCKRYCPVTSCDFHGK